MKDETTCAAVLADTLSEASVPYVFGHPGGEVVEVINALEEHGIPFVLTGHESAAAFMAQTVGRLTGIPGVCLSTLGPGACNLALGVGSAFLDRDPMIAFSARTAIDRERWSNKQNLDLNAMMAPLCKWSVALDGQATKSVLRIAFSLAASPPFGSVYLTLPGDVAAGAERARGRPILPPEPEAPDDSHLETIIDAVNRARWPVAVIGCALNRRRDAPAIDAFLMGTGIPYAVTPQGKGMVNESHPNYFGAVASAAADEPIVEPLQESDCIIGLGFDAVESAQGWHREARVYSLANAPTGFGDYQPVECTGDVTSLIGRLHEEFVGQMIWTSTEIKAVRDRVVSLMIPETSVSCRGLSPFHLVRALQETLSSDSILTTDVGAHKVLVTQAWQTSDPHGFLVTNGLSGMGFGLPSAIVAAMTFPDRPVVAVVGDGGFGMVVQELETARRVDATPLIIVCCDQALSIIKVTQDERAFPHRGVDFAPVDWARVSEGFGVQSHSVSRIDELQKAVSDWTANREPMVIAAAVDASLYTGLTY